MLGTIITTQYGYTYQNQNYKIQLMNSGKFNVYHTTLKDQVGRPYVLSVYNHFIPQVASGYEPEFLRFSKEIALFTNTEEAIKAIEIAFEKEKAGKLLDLRSQKYNELRKVRGIQTDPERRALWDEVCREITLV